MYPAALLRGKMVSSYLSVYEKITAYKTDVPSDVVICGYYGYGNAGDDSCFPAS